MALTASDVISILDAVVIDSADYGAETYTCRYIEAEEQRHRLKTSYITSTVPSRWLPKTWDSLGLKVIELLNEVGVDWASVDCFDSNGDRGGVPWMQTTLAITVYTIPVINWSLLQTICDIHVMAKARVEIRVGKLERRGEGAVRSDHFTDQAFLPPGSEVSFNYTLGDFTSGTVGGIVELFDSNGTCQKLCALTCRSYLPSPKSRSETDTDSRRTPLEQFGDIQCTYPSTSLWARNIRGTIEQIKLLNAEIQDLEEDWYRSVRESNRDVIRDHLVYTKLKKDEYRKRLKQIFEENISIGTVCAHSGSRVMENHHLDWALVELKGGRTQFINPNVVRESISFTRIKMPSDTLKPGSAVYKAKYPDFTEGNVNYTKSYLRYKDENDRVIQTTEWAVLPTPDNKQFCEPKNYGAWVVDRVRDEVVGVIFAMNPVTGLTYVTPIQEIFEDIERDTGFNVRLPIGN
ncbi:conserved hypothetical protein [Talaromyces stipitatus ATCC 10500]|uniref:Uncharacterized protein n=1 Tax=Talaromyces stipitatus (strain ATCC 10500 / CBS 375.48 / QM 6759 / NRRL 1006) TaxID=441959 RepID=B8MGC0_TALSN|nr:uncharacterized protein TSTA_013430 [Talaromyces stipitatus ATCC 10500]EED16240.1 conserved hypothetical protein [Talaromyces stipitatus ATCC 10500]